DDQEASGSGCIDHVAFAAEGFDRYAAFLGEQGYEHETRLVPGGKLRQIFVRDPNEVLIELNFRADE
ncbi:MAG: glyoxalase, partial [Alphaproteobacteria bacterium]|nr:glyoxalase [Alphaproteobacteria bacterium]